MATYFVDQHNGDDDNPGTAPDAAWRTVERVNAADLRPGDNVLFKSGDVFQASLRPNESGTAAAPIVFGRFGDGPLPVLSGVRDLTSLPWQARGERPDVWSLGWASDGERGPEMLLLSGRPAAPRAAGQDALRSEGDWFWSEGVLYLFAHEAPPTRFSTIEVPALGELIHVAGRRNLRFEDLEITGGHNGVLLHDSTAIALVDLVIHHNVRNGVHLRKTHDSTITGGSIFANGINGLDASTAHLGHGVLVGNGASGNRIASVLLYDNAEDGIQFGPRSGDGNMVFASTIFGNWEDGIDIKEGSQRLKANCIRGNAENAVLVHKAADEIRLEGNVLRTLAGGNALDVSDGARIVSLDNWYEGAHSYTLQIHPSAGDASTFSSDVFYGGGKQAGVSVVIEGGHGHQFEGVTFAGSTGGLVFHIAGHATSATIAGSVIAADGTSWLQVRNGASVSLDDDSYIGQPSDPAGYRAELVSGRQGAVGCLTDDAAGVATPLLVVVASGADDSPDVWVLPMASRRDALTLADGSPAATCEMLMSHWTHIAPLWPC